MLESIKKILVIAAHPDDEMLGCGGTLARFAAYGAYIKILLLGEGPLARLGTQKEREQRNARSSALVAAKILSIGDVNFAGFPDNAFDTVPFLHIIQWIERETADFGPDIIFTHHAGDLNLDHSITHRATLTAFRPLPQTKACTILGFEVLSSTEYASPSMAMPFVPTAYIDISSFLDKKLETLEAYISEMRDFPHPRSMEGVKYLAHLRGSQCGVTAAEAFVVIRMVL